MPQSGLRVFDYHQPAQTQEVSTGHYAYNVSFSLRPRRFLGDGAGDVGGAPLQELRVRACVGSTHGEAPEDSLPTAMWGYAPLPG